MNRIFSLLLPLLLLASCKQKALDEANARLRIEARVNEALRIHNDSLQRYIDRFYDRPNGAPAPPPMPAEAYRPGTGPTAAAPAATTPSAATVTPDTALQRLLLSVQTAGREVIIREGQYHLLLPDDLLFESGGRTLSTQGQRALAPLAAILRQVRGYRLLVEGHTDDVPIANLPGIADNWELSAMRAVEVARALEVQGVPGYLLLAAGRGPTLPVAPNDSEANRAKNRRTEIVLLRK